MLLTEQYWYLTPICDPNLQGQGLCLHDGLILARTAGQHAGQFEHFCQPLPIVFLLAFDRVVPGKPWAEMCPVVLFLSDAQFDKRMT